MPEEVSVIIPYKDAPRALSRLLSALKRQRLRPHEIIVVDSSEKHTGRALARNHGARWFKIEPSSFNHGLTRTFAAQKSKGEVLVFFTQDACPAHPSALSRLIGALSQKKVAAAFGRQVSPPAYGLLSFLHRLYNYPPRSRMVSAADIPRLGLRAAFFSNSFAAYRRGPLEEIGWFEEVPALEDQLAAAKLLLAGHRLAYVARAVVSHGHPFRVREEFRRFYRMGAFYRQYPWLLGKFGRPEGEGLRYAAFIIRELKKRKALRLWPVFLWQQSVRLLGYKWGLCFGS